MTVKEFREMINNIPTELNDVNITIDHEDADYFVNLNWTKVNNTIYIVGEEE